MREIKVEELNINPIPLFRDQWGALTAGNRRNGYNAMAIAWGSIGTLWERGSRSEMVPVCNVYVRPSRFTYPKMIENELFTVSFMDQTHRKALAYIGAKSGRDDPDKIKSSGLQLVYDGDAAYMKDSDMVLICRKIYNQQLEAEHFIDKNLIDYNYHGETDNIHEMFVGEIIRVLVKEKG